jgi:anaerobic magnesium-protoporphyrin IX monomethyl ester cyclase
MDITLANVITRSLIRLDSPTGSKLPIGLLGIASFLKSHGYEVDFRDFQTIRENPLKDIRTLAGFLKTDAPVLAVSCLSPFLAHTVAAVREIKEASPQQIVILGGMGPSPVARQLMETFPFLDGIIIGEGEVPLLMFLNGKKARDIPGLLYREGKTITQGKPAIMLSDIDSLPIPAYELWDFRKEQNSANIVTARGCHFSCAFCSDPYFWNHTYRPFGTERVLHDIRTLIDDYGQTYITLEDDTFTADRQRALKLVRAFVEERFQFTWAASARVDCVDPELLGAMKEAGCQDILLGLESGSDRLLKVIKNISLAEMHKALSMIKDHGMGIWCSFIWGYPDETLEDFRQTLNQIALLTEFFQIRLILYNFMPFPSLPVFERIADQLFLSDEVLKITYHTPFLEAPEVKDLVLRYPRLFSSYHCAPSEGFSEKLRILSSFEP